MKIHNTSYMNKNIRLILIIDNKYHLLFSIKTNKHKIKNNEQSKTYISRDMW